MGREGFVVLVLLLIALPGPLRAEGAGEVPVSDGGRNLPPGHPPVRSQVGAGKDATQGGEAAPAPGTEPARRVTGRVTVDVSAPGAGTPVAVAGARVVLQAADARGNERRLAEGTTDAGGRAVFDGVEASAAETLTARTAYQGVDYRSAPFRLGPEVSARLDVFPVTSDPSAIRVARVEMELLLWEGSVVVRESLDLVASDNATVVVPGEPGTGPEGKGGTGGLAFPLPPGAGGAEASAGEGSAQVVSGKIVFWGPVRPASSQPTRLNLTFQMGTHGSRLAFRQSFPGPVEEAVAYIPQVPMVEGRVLEGVSIGVEAGSSFARVEPMAGGALGTSRGSFHIARGLREKGTREIAFVLTGLPARSHTGAGLAVALGLASWLGVGLYLAAGRSSARHGGGGRER